MKKIPFQKKPDLLGHLPALPLLFFLPLLVYLGTLGPCFLDGDSPETVTAGATLGVPHPPGYALSILTTRLFTLVPLGNPAFAAALGSALWASGSILLMFILLTRVSGRATPYWSSACLALFLAFSPHFWGEALSPKGAVYTLQALLLLSFLLAFQKGGDPGPGVLLFGLGLSNHWPIQVCSLPLLLLLVRGSQPKIMVRCGALLGLGLSPLLALPLLSRLRPALDLGAPDTFPRLWAHLSRKVYSLTQEFQAPGNIGAFLEERGLYMAQHHLAFPGLLVLPLALWGFYKASPKVRTLSIPLGVLWTVLWLFPSVPDTFPTLDRFLLPADALLLIFAGIGAKNLFVDLRPSQGRIFAGILVLMVLSLGIGRFQKMDQEGAALRFDYGMDLLRSAPPGALLFAEADEDVFTLYYLQEVLGKRRDVRTVPSFLLFEGWGVERTAHRFPELGLAGPETFPQDPLGRMSAAAAQLWVDNRGRRPIAFTLFEGALHRYVLPSYPSLRYRPMGLLGVLEDPALKDFHFPGRKDLRTRSLGKVPSGRHLSLEGILRLYRDLGPSPAGEAPAARP